VAPDADDRAPRPQVNRPVPCTHPELMRVGSGPVHAPKVHFEAAPSDCMAVEMDAFIAWFNRTAPNGVSPLSALIRAGMTHLYFECIHPFEDGNGRIGRARAKKALAQCLGQPSLLALADTIGRHQKDYYDALEQANKDNEITRCRSQGCSLERKHCRAPLAVTLSVRMARPHRSPAVNGPVGQGIDRYYPT